MNSPVQRPRLTITENTDPFALFAIWFDEARATEPNDPDAAALATADAGGMPSARMVLVKDVTTDGFTFFTNTRSKKGQELAANPRAALCFHWKSQLRQVRVQGIAAPVTATEADAYFNSRHPRSRRGAIASQQSRPLTDITALEDAVEALERDLPDDAAIPRPAHWSGFRIVPTRIEFWQQGDNRLHDRFVFARPDATLPWTVARLYP